jgi:U2 small nuclear ribonucleoprotein A'
MLGNFPLSPRLRTLLLARNRVSSIQPTLANSLPNLTTLVLTSNNFAELADLDVLSTFTVLTHLVLVENPVTRKEVCCVFLSTQAVDGCGLTREMQHYRTWVVWRCPAVRFLDYKKVKDAEREKGKVLFGTHKEPSQLALKVSLNYPYVRGLRD